MKSVIRMFVKCPSRKEGTAFPRLRLIVLLREFMEISIHEATMLLDEEWPLELRESFDYHDEHGLGIRISLVTDDAGIGRIYRAIHRYKSMDFIVDEIDEVGRAFAHARRAR